MFDSLLGRKALKEEISALEAEVDRLESQLEAESGRRANAVSEKQRVEEERNRLQDRIADLEGKLERLQTGESAAQLHFSRTTYSPQQIEPVISLLESLSGPPESIATGVLTDSIPEPLEEPLGQRTVPLRGELPALVVTDDTGILTAILRPPLMPDPFLEWSDSPTIDRSWFLPEGEYTLALVRSDQCAIGHYRGMERRSMKTVSTPVKGNHSKGGFSQDRFERRRDDQIRAHVEAAREALEDTPEPRYLVGDERILDDLEDLSVTTKPVPASGGDNTALEAAFDDFWETTVLTI